MSEFTDSKLTIIDDPAIIKPLYEKFKSTYLDAAAKFDQFKKSVIASNLCTHPETWKNVKNQDNGYGKWWKIEVTKCVICNKQIGDTRYL